MVVIHVVWFLFIYLTSDLFACLIITTFNVIIICLIFFSDVLRGVQKVSEELYTPFHCHQVFFYVFSLELVSAAVHIYFYQSNIRLCGYDHYIAQLCLPSQNRFSWRSWVSIILLYDQTMCNILLYLFFPCNINKVKIKKHFCNMVQEGLISK